LNFIRLGPNKRRLEIEMEVANRKKGLKNGNRNSTLQFNDDIEEFAINPLAIDNSSPTKSSPNKISLSKRRSSVGGKRIADMYKTVIQMANENVSYFCWKFCIFLEF
jgi:negative regulator of sigma E activity